MDQRYTEYPSRRRNLAIPLLIALVVIAALGFGIFKFWGGISRKLDLDLTSPYVCVVDVKSGKTLLSKDADAQILPASTTKLLTALTVLDYCDPDLGLTASTELELIAEDSSRAWLNQGDYLSVQQLLVALLLPSGNDAAYTLAVNTGRQITGNWELSDTEAVSEFAAAMNRKAQSLGASSSNFVSPDGYDAEGQYTTAADLAIIAAECLNSPLLMDIMGSYSISDVWLGGRDVTYTNSNQLLNPESPYYYPNATGMKTGFSSAAGACLVSSAEVDGKTYICVTMCSTNEGRFADAVEVFRALER